MRIAILMTNTDESEFAYRFALDGEKFTNLMRLARPDWDYPVFSVKDGVFPERLDGIDGAMITGSPASVNCGAEWVAGLEELIRAMAAAKKPLFGACFGHQAIAKALGGTVGKNPGGWVFGKVAAQWQQDARHAPGPARQEIYASHSEQVLQLPEGAEITARGPGCDAAGFVIGDHVMTTQYHPEMEPEFIAALLDLLAPELGHEVTARARASLTTPPDMAAHAAWIARFFEADRRV